MSSLAGVALWTRSTGTGAADTTDESAATRPQASTPATPAATPESREKKPIASSSQPTTTAVSNGLAPRPGTDAPFPSGPASKPSRFTSGWVYLGDYDNGNWTTRYFNGWSAGTPVVGTKISARGRSYVRVAPPNAIGSLATPRTSIGGDNSVEILELAYWQHSSFLWARVKPAW